jgi:dihydrofolate reductase
MVQPMRISLIVAMSRNRVIGIDNRLPWHLPGDLKRFRSLTMGHAIIMGRRTWESIGRPLPGRRMLVVSRQPDYRVEGATVCASLEGALAACRGDDEVFVIGGEQLFAAALPAADRIYLTVVEADFAGDTWMPDFDAAQWREVERASVGADATNAHACTYSVYDRVRLTAAT